MHSKDDLQAYLRYNVRHALANSGNKTYLYRAIRKYGPEAFSIKSLVRAVDKDQMDALEIFFIRTLETQNPEIGYNITAGGGGRLGTKRPHTEAEKAHMKEVMTGRNVTWGDKISATQKGKTLTPEHIAALKIGQKGCKKPPRSPEHLRKISENSKARWAKLKARVNA
jgi:group I intron endonuclease